MPELTPERIAAMRAAKSTMKSVVEMIASANLNRTGQEIAKIQARLEIMPETSRRTYLRAVAGKSPAAAIKAFCMMCVNWERLEVRLCTDPACPLFAYRPFSNKDTPLLDGEDSDESDS